MMRAVRELAGVLAVPVVLAVMLVASVLWSNGHTHQATATTEPAPLYTCATIRDRKVCNIATEVYDADYDLWIGRFAACAPKLPTAAVPLTVNGYTARVIVWCGK